MTGKVKWWIESKGYGFIIDEEGNDVFVHYKDIRMGGRRNLQEAQEVQFDVVSTPRGRRAQNVRPVGETETTIAS